MTELTIRRIAIGLIADNTCYIADNNADERTIMLAYIRGIITMANDIICALEEEEKNEQG